jgi:protease I
MFRRPLPRFRSGRPGSESGEPKTEIAEGVIDMADSLSGKTIAFLVAPEGIEQVELTEPWKAVQEAGGTPRLVSTEPGEVQAFHHLDKGDRFPVDDTVDAADPSSFDGLVLPGGVANPDYLRMQPKAVAFAKAFVDSGKPVAAICHAPWTLVEADVVRGRRMTSWPSLRTDLRNAGADWVDEEVVVDENGPGVLITSRKPDDLKAFCAELVDRF